MDLLSTVPAMVDPPKEAKLSFAFEASIGEVVWDPEWGLPRVVLTDAVVAGLDVRLELFSSIVKD